MPSRATRKDEAAKLRRRIEELETRNASLFRDYNRLVELLADHPRFDEVMEELHRRE